MAFIYNSPTECMYITMYMRQQQSMPAVVLAKHLQQQQHSQSSKASQAVPQNLPTVGGD
jgi:hypothetical protein